MAEPHCVTNEWTSFKDRHADQNYTCQECGEDIKKGEVYMLGTWSTTDHTAQRYADVECEICFPCYLNITESSGEDQSCSAFEDGCSIM